MRPWILALACLSVISCKGKHEASSGKEWLEKFQKAAKERDAETCWKMFSKETQKKQTSDAAELKGMAKGDMAKMLKEEYKLEKEVETYSDEELAKKMLFGKDGLGEESAGWKFVEEKAEGDGVALTIERTGGKKSTCVLIKEDGSLKFDLAATKKKRSTNTGICA